MFDQLKVAKYRFVIEAGEQGLELPPFKSSAFRGGFGHVFRQLTCAYPGRDCSDCSLQNSCPYVYVFETKPPVGSKVLRNFESVPRPYVISTEFEGKKYFRPGEKLDFELLIFGDALAYLPFFIHSFELLGTVGIGKGRRPYSVNSVEAIDIVRGHRHQVYDHTTKRMRQKDVSLSGKDIMDRVEHLSEKSVKVTFDTPLRMKWKGSYTAESHFHLLIRNAVRRVSSLLYFHHGGEELEIPFSELFQKAEQIELIQSDVQWVDWERYSARQDTRMTLGGIIGTSTYRGELQEFIPWLVLSETIHIGKQTAFGLGKIGLVLGV